MIRGNERKNIFIDDKDKLRFMETINQMKDGQRFKLHAFCLMDNHVHLLISEGTEDIARVIKRIAVSYVFYFNKKYKRVGHLFQDRFKSESVEEDNYILSLARYIHQNPVKAGMVKNPGDYQWSSYNGYIDKNSYICEALDKEMIMDMFSEEREIAKSRFVKYMNEDSTDEFIDLKGKIETVDEEEAHVILENLLNDRKIENEMPDDLIREFKELTGLSNRKVAEITKINKEKINKIVRNSIQ